MSAPTLSHVLDVMSHMERADIAQALREYMNHHKVTVARVAKELNVPRVLIRDLLMDRITPEPDKCGFQRTMTSTLIAQGQVYVTPWADDEHSIHAWETIRQYHLDFGTTDVYMSLEDVSGARIREFELRKGRIHRDYDGATAIRVESHAI